MNPAFCLVCNDVKHFHSAVNESRRIANAIKDINLRFNNFDEINDPHLRNDFSMDHNHVHFMCGVCFKVNEEELRSEERKIVSELLKFCNTIDQRNKADLHSVLRYLQGYYPLMYKTLERYYYTKRKETDELS